MRPTERGLPEGHRMTLVFSGSHGHCLSRLGRFAEAEPLVTESCEKLAIALGTRHDHTLLAIRRCILLYETWNKPDAVAHWQARLAGATAPVETTPSRATDKRRE